MKSSATSPPRLRTAAKVLRRGGLCLAVVGVFIFLVTPRGESEGDERPITAAMYAVGFLIAGGVAASSELFFTMHPQTTQRPNDALQQTAATERPAELAKRMQCG